MAVVLPSRRRHVGIRIIVVVSDLGLPRIFGILATQIGHVVFELVGCLGDTLEVFDGEFHCHPLFLVSMGCRIFGRHVGFAEGGLERDKFG